MVDSARAMLLTMRDVAGRWQVALSTAHQYLAEVRADRPHEDWCCRRGRHIRLTERQYRRLTEAVWGITSPLPDPARVPEPASTAPPRMVGGSQRSRRTRETKAWYKRLQDDMEL